MRMGSLAAAAGMALAVLSTQGIAAQAAEIKIIAGTVMTPVFGELGPEFERATGHKLVIKYGVTGAMKRQIEGGEAFDLAIVSSALLDGLIKQGKIAADWRAKNSGVRSSQSMGGYHAIAALDSSCGWYSISACRSDRQHEPR